VGLDEGPLVLVYTAAAAAAAAWAYWLRGLFDVYFVTNLKEAAAGINLVGTVSW
jgi:hypothetical protein